MGRLSKYIRPYVGYIILSMVIKLIGAVMELFVPYLMEIILDDVVPSGGRRWVFIYGALMLLCAGGCLLANIIANRMSAISSGKITLAIRHDLFERLSRWISLPCPPPRPGLPATPIISTSCWRGFSVWESGRRSCCWEASL